MNQPANKAKHLPSFRSHTVRVQIGDVCCGMNCSDTEMFCSLRELFNNFLSDQPADISIELNGVEPSNPAEPEAVSPEGGHVHEGNHFRMPDGIIGGTYDLAHRTVSISERSLVGPNPERNILNRLLYLAYYSACKVRHNGDPPAFLVHACGIVRHGQALVFAGPSGVGKTTIARLCGEQHGEVINDEMLLISRPVPGDDALVVQGVPVIGGYHQRSNRTAPLRGILLLKQSEQARIRSVSRTEAYLRFIRQIITPAYVGQKDMRVALSLMADFSAEVTRTIPFYELEFSLDGESLWRTVGELEGVLAG